MKAIEIPDYEKSFREKGRDAQGKTFQLTPSEISIPETSENLNLVECVPENNDQSFYYQETVEKNKIVLHFTAGYLKGDISRLTTTNSHVSVPYIIARDGTIYQLWDPKYWSYHLGRGAVGGNTNMSKSSIAIELSNIGYLRKVGDNLVTAYSDSDVYCSLSDQRYYTNLTEDNFRGYEYYATFTDMQYKSLPLLLKYLTRVFNIPANFITADKRYQTLSAVELVPFSGIVSHINFRESEKWDIGPAFEWEQLINGLK